MGIKENNGHFFCYANEGQVFLDALMHINELCPYMVMMLMHINELCPYMVMMPK